jgi:hypothetical protein
MHVGATDATGPKPDANPVVWQRSEIFLHDFEGARTKYLDGTHVLQVGHEEVLSE